MPRAGHRPAAACLLLLLVSCCASATAVDQARPAGPDPLTLYVSTEGNDHANGRAPQSGPDNTHGPFATLERARDELRQLSRGNALPNGAQVMVRGGTYELGRTFKLESSDSGTEQSPVVFRAYENEQVILSGGRKPGECRPAGSGAIQCSTRNLQLEQLEVTGPRHRLDALLPPFEVFLDGKRQQLARWPDSEHDAPGGDTWAYIADAPPGSRTQFSFNGDFTPGPDALDDAVLHIWPGNDWFDQYLGIDSIAGRDIFLAAPATYPIQAGRRFSILNVPQAMDSPGEWYYSKRSRQLRLIPGNTPATERPVLSWLEHVISVDNAANIRIEGFIVEYSRGTAIRINGGRNISVAGCTIRNVGGHGIEVTNGTGHSVNGSKIYDTGLGAIVLDGGDRQSLTPAGHTASGNDLHHTGRLVRAGIAALRLKGVGNTAASNRIHHTPGMAAEVLGNDHTLERNDIHHACEQSADCGAVYTGRDWTFRGNTIRDNRIHDVYGYGLKQLDRENGVVVYQSPRGARGVYIDDAASGFLVTGNLFYRIPYIMLQIGGGRDNIIDNNVFITNGYAVWMDARWPGFPWDKTMKKRLNSVPYTGKTWRSRYPELAKPMRNPEWPEGNRITHNIIVAKTPGIEDITSFKYTVPPGLFHTNNNLVWNQGRDIRVDYRLLDSGNTSIASWTTWQASGYDRNSLQAPPRFIDPAGGNFSLREDSPARTLGIRPITPNDQTAHDVDRTIGERQSPLTGTYRHRL